MIRTTALVAAAALAALTPAFAIPPVPRHAPEFVVQLPNGAQKLLSSYRGKVVCIEFLYTTCPHCQHASEVMSKLYSEFGAKGFQPLGVAFNPEVNGQLVTNFVQSYGVNYPIGSADRDTVISYLGISAVERFVVPQLLWIDRKGQIVSQTPALGDEKMLQEDYWRQMIEKLTAEPATSARPRHTKHRSAASASLR